MGPQGNDPERDPWVRRAEKKLGCRFRNPALLRAALTHPSAGKEGKVFARLEFLGDAVLTHLVSLDLYQRYPHSSPGELTRLRASIVNRSALAQAATRLGLPLLLRMGRGEEPAGRHRPALLAAALETVIGALFLDRGTRSVTRFVGRHLFHVSSHDASLDPKSELQTCLQAALKTRPRYRLLRHWGPPHARRFEVEVGVRGHTLGRGRGENRREAEQAAARAALSTLPENHNILGSALHEPHDLA